MQNGLSLQHYLSNNQVDVSLSRLLLETALTTKEIAQKIDRASLEGALGMAGSENIQGESQKKLDIITNDVMYDHLKTTGLLAGMVSEEVDDPMQIPKEFDKGDYLIYFDPLDGSSNIDVNTSVGTIFSIVKNPKGTNTPELKDYLQDGNQQVSAGFVVYGPSTTLVLTTGNGVAIFTLDKSIGEYTLVRDKVMIPEDTQEFAINMSNQRFWETPVQAYIADCLAGETGVLAKRYSMRWVASMVAEIFRILTRGGIFLYPMDARNKKISGKLRLMYEANPISFIVEQAGGMSSTGRMRIMDVPSTGLHQRVPVIMGSKNEVSKVVAYHINNG